MSRITARVRQLLVRWQAPVTQGRASAPEPVGCCDSSKNTHATKHFKSTGHPLIQSIQPGEDWIWCYVDQVMMEPS